MIATFAIYSLQSQSLTGVDQGAVLMRYSAVDASWQGFYLNKKPGDLGVVSSKSVGKNYFFCEKNHKISGEQLISEQFCTEA